MGASPLTFDDIAPGTHLGHFVIVDHIAQGGMGTVFKAMEPALERYVAIKVLRPEFAQNQEYLNFFQQEARAVAALRHGNIVPIHYIGVEGEVAFFAMGYIDGKTFDDWIEAGIKFTPAQATWFLTQAIAALEAAWHERIVHLDIKPANFLIDHYNTILLTDFGLAQKMNEAMDKQEERDAFGTPAYVSPEQITREKTDQRTDIYSLGASLYHLMVGRPPFDGQTVEDIVWAHLEKPFPVEAAQAVGVPDGWIYLIKRMMERAPEDRFQNYGELQAALNEVDSFRYETTELPPPPPEVLQLVNHRDDGDPELLFGLLKSSNWNAGSTQNINVVLSPKQVLTSLHDQAETLSIAKMAGTVGELCRSTEGDMDDLLGLLETLPGFHAAIYHLADFMAKSSGDELPDEEAMIETIGLVRAQNLALTFVALNYELAPSNTYDWAPLWRHSMSTAIILDFMYDALDLKRSGIEFAAGLTHDIGKIIFADLFPFAFYGMLRRSLTDQKPLSQCERDACGVGHAELSAKWLHAHTAAPAGLAEVVALHETPELLKRKSILAHALVAANQLAKQLGHGYSGNACLDPRPWSEIPSVEIVWGARRNLEYEFEEFTEGFPAQFQELPNLL